MSTPNVWFTLRRGFQRLRVRSGGRLRADHQSGGWGRVERETLQALSAGDPSPSVQRFAPVRSELESAAAEPRWFLAGAQSADAEFKQFADRGAALTGHVGIDGWLVWLDQVLVAGIGDRRHYDGDVPITRILDVCAASVQYCDLLAAGHVLPAPAAAINDVSADRRARVAAYCSDAHEATGKRSTQAMIYRAAGYDKTEFYRWLRNDPVRQPTARAAAAFERVLVERPHMIG